MNKIILGGHTSISFGDYVPENKAPARARGGQSTIAFGDNQAQDKFVPRTAKGGQSTLSLGDYVETNQRSAAPRQDSNAVAGKVFERSSGISFGNDNNYNQPSSSRYNRGGESSISFGDYVPEKQVSSRQSKPLNNITNNSSYDHYQQAPAQPVKRGRQAPGGNSTIVIG